MADLKNIALTVEATQIAADLRPKFGLGEQADLIRLAFAYAVSHGLEAGGPLPGTRGGSNYDTGGLDPEGLMAAVIELYWPQSNLALEPYRAVEVLMNRGMQLLSEHLHAGDIGSLSDVVASPANR